MSFCRFSARAMVVTTLLAARPALAAPGVEEALKYAPVQEGVDYDSPTPAEAKACKITAEKINGATGWVVRGPDEAILREFIDSNADNTVDTWCYFRGGLEVYRDIDANFNKKADQYRWFHTGGTRWGLDKNEDGKIDAWKAISAEEASEEVINALRTKDAARFARLLVTADDVSKLGLAKPVAEQLSRRVAAAPKAFATLASAGSIDPAAKFTDFGGQRPGMVPAGTRGGTKDLLVYENVWCMALTGEKHQQVQLGSMVNIDGSWKLIDGPAFGAGDQEFAGFFYNVEGLASQQATTAALNEPTKEMQAILESLQKIDADLIAAAAEKKPALNAERADLLERLADSTPAADRDQWIKQLADSISFAVQDGTYPDGVVRLEKLEAKLTEAKASEDLLSHVEFRRMQAAWGLSMADPKFDYAKSQPEWLAQLEKFVTAHKEGENVAEALFQLAIGNELPPGDPEKSKGWYERLAAEFPNSANADQARGALRRLTAVGKPMTLKGPALQGGVVDLSQYKGRVVLIHYWSSAAPSAKADHVELLELYDKYGGRKFEVVGVCLDDKKDTVVAYLKDQKLPWKQIYEPGGLFENRLATEMGIIQLPQMILVDEKGLVVSTNVLTAELGAELKKLIPSEVAQK